MIVFDLFSSFAQNFLFKEFLLTHAIFVVNYDLSSFDFTQQKHHQQREGSIEIELTSRNYEEMRDLLRRKKVLEMNQDYRRVHWLHHQGRPERCIEKGNSLRKPS